MWLMAMAFQRIEDPMLRFRSVFKSFNHVITDWLSWVAAPFPSWAYICTSAGWRQWWWPPRLGVQGLKYEVCWPQGPEDVHIL